MHDSYIPQNQYRSSVLFQIRYEKMHQYITLFASRPLAPMEFNFGSYAHAKLINIKPKKIKINKYQTKMD